jgi:hypothetical protein
MLNFHNTVLFFCFCLQKKKQFIFGADHEIKAFNKQKKMRNRILFIQDTKKSRALTLFMPLSLYVMNSLLHKTGYQKQVVLLQSKTTPAVQPIRTAGGLFFIQMSVNKHKEPGVEIEMNIKNA